MDKGSDTYGNDVEIQLDGALSYSQQDQIAAAGSIKANSNAHPLFHSDRGFRYTNRVFYNELKKAKMKQSMSRVAKCIDNDPMEGFWGILKRERYYGKRFANREELVQMIENFIF